MINKPPAARQARVIDLTAAPGERASWDRPSVVVFAWSVVELLLVTNAWQISSSLRVKALRLFGAEIGDHVVFRPRTRVKFPWKLHIGDNSWIGEGVWIHNQDHVFIGSNVVISQETMLTTGSHRHRSDMALVTRPIHIEDGAWVTSRCMVLGGVRIGRSAVLRPMTVVDADVEEDTVSGGGSREVSKRF
ncbi:LbetaH domain-containing protein [Pseudarthrobacter oxydans]|uniref:acetyltransferase n=1 Tax=Pseudarthrobacter oxydans TaxID=1671 RepID=UPI00381752E9